MMQMTKDTFKMTTDPETGLNYMLCHHSLGATGATLNTRNASS